MSEVYREGNVFCWEHDGTVERFPEDATLTDVRDRLAAFYGVEPEQIRFRSEVLDRLRELRLMLTPGGAP